MPVQNLELTFASKEDSLSVRSYDIRESLSGVFTVDVVARSEIPDIDLESIVGHGATFRIMGDDARVRAWTGVCAHMEEIQAEEAGLSTYLIRIVPTFWRATLRENMRIFELKTLPDIVKELLLEWEIEPELRLSGEYLKHEYRVQYLETDFAFISRLLEEAGITYFFEFEGQKTKMVLTDTPGNGPSRGAPLPYVEGHTTEGRKDFLTKLRVTTHVRSGHFAIRDFDFRLKPDYKLFQEHKDGIDRELKLERYQYLPGSFWVESQGASLPVADDKGIYKSDENHGKARARLALEAERTGRRVVRFETNAVDLAPGKTFMVEQHPRKDVAKKLLVASMTLQGKQDGDYQFHVEALFADDPVRPAKKTPRPRIMGVQSALVVGPPGEEIHTDEFGRVRAQFHWDREHTYTDESSCWIRVSQGWAGLGYGMIVIPRVGQEVLVEFFDGDPDRPVIIGRVYNNTSRVPYPLPESKTKSGWKTDSSPGSNGFNELMFEDKKGSEEIHIQAEKDYSEIIKNNQSSTVLANRSASVTSNDSITIGKSLSINVGDSETHTVKKAIMSDAGELFSIHVASGTGTEIRDRSIVSTTGGASIILAGDDIILQAKGQITLVANTITRVHGKQEVQIEGGNTFINCGDPGDADPQPFDRAKPPSAPGSGGAINDSTNSNSGRQEVAPPGGIDEATPNVFVQRPKRSPEDAPPNVAIDGAAAAAITQAVSATPAMPAATAILGSLTKEHLSKALTVVTAVKNLKETKGLSLLEVPEFKQAIGSVVTSPIVGDFSGKDIADVLNLGQKFGIWHLGSDATAATDFISKAADAPPGVTQMMGVKTDATPAKIDGAALDADITTAVQSGAPIEKAQAKALAKQGVALYAGDFSGAFRKVTG